MLRSLAAKMPPSAKRRLRRLVRGSANPYFPGVRGVASISDLYFWIADGELDTVLLLENYFSRLFPDLDTRTETTVEFLDADGRTVAKHRQAIDHMAAPVLRASEVLADAGSVLRGTADAYGNVIWYTAVPAAVRAHMAELGEDMLFWDRGYIGYLGPNRQIAFVHGVDKTAVAMSDLRRAPWPIGPEDTFTASPEIPVEFSEYASLEMIVQNRDTRPRTIDLQVMDVGGRELNQSKTLQPMGVARFMLNADMMDGFDASVPFRLRCTGLPTRFGRPIALKRFHDGPISLMHC